MTSILVATASVHTTAAACDYLEGRVDGSDTVYLLTVRTDSLSGRDAGDAANVARTRLFEPAVETIQRPPAETGEKPANVAPVIRAVAGECDVDEIILGATRGDPERAGESPGSTVRTVLESATRPVVVLPL